MSSVCNKSLMPWFQQTETKKKSLKKEEKEEEKKKKKKTAIKLPKAIIMVDTRMSNKLTG